MGKASEIYHQLSAGETFSLRIVGLEIFFDT